MSRTIDERVVSMQFDNKQFESNVRTSLGTIEKLKQSLNFKGASKGLENIHTAAKGCNLAPLSSAVDSVRVKFSAMEVMAVTALSRITNSAITTGKRMVSALTIDPVKTGLQEYETQINAIQTILANTESKGETLDTVNAALDELNTYADKTIYNFTEMTRNIGTFTAAGVGLKESTAAIKGIANLAAVSGSSSQQASTAMYQLSQALAAGRVSLMDWNSVVNAGMGGELFQNALKRTARQMGTGVDAAIKKYGTFRESLTQGQWLTTEVLTETLAQLSGAYTEADLIAQGYTKDQAAEIAKLADTAVNAATKVKTFTQLWDTLKESAQSGWTQTWELIIGDFGEAKNLWTAVSDEIGGIIGARSDKRNKFLSGALTSKWDQLTQKIGDAGIETERFESTLKETAKSHGYNIDKLIEEHGSLEDAFRSGEISSKVLRESIKKLEGDLVDLTDIQKDLKKGSTGDDVKKVQKALKDLGYDIGKFGDGSGVDGIIGSVTEKAIKDFQKAQGLEVTGIIDEKTIAAIEKASGSVDGLYKSVKGLISGIDELGGRELLLESFANIWKGLKSVLRPIRNAFKVVFPPATSEQLYKLIEGFHKLTENLTLSGGNAHKVFLTFRGLFSILKVVTDVVGGGLKVAFKVFSKILSSLDLNILDVTSAIGEAIYGFRNWLVENDRLTKGFEKVIGWLINGAIAVRDWVKAFIDLPVVQENLAKIKTAFSDFFGNLPSLFTDMKGLFGDFWKSLTSMDTISLDNVKQVFSNLWKSILSYFSNMENPFSGIVEAFKNFRDDVVTYFEDSGAKIGEFKTTLIDFVKAVKQKLGDNMGKILALGTLIAFLLIVKKIKDAIELIAHPFDMLDDFLDGLGKSVKQFAKSVAIKNIASSIAILAASVAVLALLPQTKVWSAVGAIVLLGAGLVVLAKMMDKVDAKDLSKLSLALLSMGGALLLMALAVRTMGGMEGGDWLKGTLSVVAFMGMIAVIAKSTSKLGSGIDDFGRMMVKLSIALLSLALVVKIFGNMDTGTLLKGGGAVAIFLGTMVGLMWATKLIGTEDVDKFGVMMLKLSTALLLMGFAIKLLGRLDFETAIKGGGAAAIFLGSMVGMMYATKLISSGDMAKFGTMMLGIGGSLILMAATIKILAGIDASDIVKGELAIAGMGAIIVGLMWATKLLGKYSFNSGKVGVMFLGFAAAVLMITGSILMLSMIDKSDLKKATLAVTGIGVILGGLLFVTKYAKSIKVGTILALSIAIGVLAASVAALSFIDGKKLAGATIAISAITGMFALLAASVKTMSLKTMASIGVMVLAVGALAYIIYKLTEVSRDSGAAVKMAIALSTLILALSASCVILAGIGATGPAALWGVLILAAVLAVVAGFVALGIASLPKIGEKLSEFAENLRPFIDIVKEIDPELQAGMKTLAETILLLTGAGILDSLTGGSRSLKNFGEQLKPFAEGLAEFSSIVSSKSFNASAINNAAEAAKALVNLANSLPVQPGWIQKLFFGEKDLGVFGTQLKGFADGLSAFSEKVSGTNFDSNAILSAATAAESLVELANKIPDNEGAWISKLFVGHKDLSTFGTQLVGLGEGLVSFSNSVSGKSIDPSAITAAAEATGALAEVADKIPDNEGNWISKLFVGQKDLSTFGTQLIGLGTGLVAFSESVSGKSFDSVAVTAAAEATGALAEVANAIPDNTGDWISKLFVGHKDLSAFGTQLSGLGSGLVSFSESVSGGTFDPVAVSSAAKATESLAEVANAIPDNTGDWISKLFVGHKDLSTFGTQLVGLGVGLVSFSDTLTGHEFDSAAVSSAAKATTGLAEVAKAIPDNTGDWISKLFVGHKDLSTFGTQLVGLGVGLVSFSDTVTGHNFDGTAVSSAAKAAAGLAEVANAIPDNTGDWISKLFVGNKDLGQFGTQLSGFGEGLVAFSDSVTGETFDSEAVSSAAKAAAALVELSDALPEGTSWIEKFFFGKEDLSTFGTKLTSFGEGMQGFSDAVTGLDVNGMSAAATAASTIVSISKDIGDDGTGAIAQLGNDIMWFGKQLAIFFEDVSLMDVAMFSTIATSIKNLASFGKQLQDLDFSGLSNLGDSLSKIGTDGVDEFIAAFENAGPRLKTAGSGMITMLTTGIVTGSALLTAMCTGVVSMAISAVNTGYTGFYNAGKNVVQGFANGITDNTYLATAKAKAMAMKAYEAAKKALDINSPSKIFRSLGTSVPEGFAMGIDKLGSMVKSSAVGMADTAISGTKNAIARIADAINSDIDAQPTIRPVLDLTNVAAGASSISGMFGMRPSVGVMSNIGAISSSMGNRQNGNNNDVISAIEKLGSQISNKSGDTYNIDGVTYDDGSNISTAVGDIVRAAKVERRR